MAFPMRNDEKIDIQLNEVSEEDLTAEEVAQQHYNTALRYINIAEHMKQFEDQDKYYHRAIKYLRLARPYMEVRPLLRNLRKKKYAARAEGKIALYEEACQIRDRAKTPNDYYSAQTVFDRIHRHELKHKIPKRRVSPELYQRLSECADSEQQSIECGKMAEKKAAEMKRHSLFVSICFIAVIIALLAFSRTILFYQCAGAVLSFIGDHDTSWRAYNVVYERTKDMDAYEKYQEQRYQAALDAEDSDDSDTLDAAYTSFYTLARDNYKDSADHLITMEKENIRQAALGDIVMFANLEWRVLEKQDNQALLIKDKAISDIPFRTADTTDTENDANTSTTWENSSARDWLNGAFLNENFCQAEIDAIKETAVTAEDNPVYGTDAGQDTIDKVYLLSSGEASRYYDILHGTETCWWLRTPGAHTGSMCFVYPDKTVMNYGYDSTDDTFTIKPVMWVDISE